MAYQFKIQLQDVSKPTVWRRVMVAEKLTFHEFHEVIQLAFGWDDVHIYQFSPTGFGDEPVIGILTKDDWEQPELDSMKTKLNKFFTHEKQTFYYCYDFGDDWSHHIVLEKIVPEPVKIPVCLEGKGKCPPEDSNGESGYGNMKIILADPSHSEYKIMKQWLGLKETEEWDVNEVDLEEVNERLKEEFRKDLK